MFGAMVPNLYWVGTDSDIRETLHSLCKDQAIEFHALSDQTEYFSQKLHQGCTLLNLEDIHIESFFQHEKSRALPCLVISADSSYERVLECMKFGAFSFLAKPLHQEKVMHYINEAISVSENWFQSYQFISAGNHLIKNLTPREHQIFRLLIHGNTNKTIAECLGISARTVEVHRSHIMSKLQTKNLYDLIILSIATGEVRDWRLESIQFAYK